MTPPLTMPAETGRPYDATKNDATIIAVWRHGQSDTVDLARRFHITEAHAYHIIANRPAKIAPSGSIRYAGSTKSKAAP